MNYDRNNREDDELSLGAKQAVVFGITLLVILLTAILVYIFTHDAKEDAGSIQTDSGITTDGEIAVITDPPATSAPETEAPETVEDIRPVTSIDDIIGDITTAVTSDETVGESAAESAPETSSWTPVVTAPDALAEQYPGVVLTETTDAGEAYVKQIIFLGDSTTYGLKYYEVLDGGKQTKQVWTPTSGTLTLDKQSFAKILYPDDNTEILIKDAAAKKKPNYMIITLGVNGISYLDEETFKKEYTNLIKDIQKASPDTIIMLQSIFPVARSYQYQKSINNEKINAANTWVVEIAKELGLRYLNTASVLMDAEGYLPEEYQNGDGLHLNEVSAALVIKYIRTHAYVE